MKTIIPLILIIIIFTIPTQAFTAIIGLEIDTKKDNSLFWTVGLENRKLPLGSGSALCQQSLFFMGLLTTRELSS